MSECDSNLLANCTKRDGHVDVNLVSSHNHVAEIYSKAEVCAKVPVDKGWAWAVLAGSTLICTIIIGILLSHGIFLYEIVHKYNSKNEYVNWIFGLFGLCHTLVVPIANNLSDVLSTRWIVFTGALLISMGFFLSTFVNSMNVYFVTYGIIAGVGNGLTVYPAQLLLNKYFQRYRVLANGVMLSGGPLGTIIFPMFINYLINQYSLRGMFLIMSAVTMHLVVAAALFRPISFYVGKERCISERRAQEAPACSSWKERKKVLERNVRTRIIDSWNVAKNGGFLLFTFATMGIFIALTISMLMLPSLMILNLGLDQHKVERALLIYGISTLFGRLSAGPIADRKWIKLQIHFAMAQTVVAICVFFISINRSYSGVLVYCILLGLSGGQCMALYAPVFVDELGLKNLVHALSLMPIFHSAFQFSLPILFGLLRDTLGNWFLCFRIIGIFNASSVLLIFIYVICGRRRYKDEVGV